MIATINSKWIKAYTIFLAVFAFGAGITAYIAPEAMFSMIQIDWDTVKMLSNGFAARNISIGIFAVFAIWSKNTNVYLALFVTRLTIDFQDLLNGITVGAESIPPIATIGSLGVLFIAPLILGIITLKKEISQIN